MKLSSVQQLDQEVANRRREVAALTDAKARLQSEQAALQAQQAALAQRLGGAQAELQQTSQRLFVLLGELDRLLQIQERVRQRAAQKLREQAAAAGPHRTATIDDLAFATQRAHPRTPLAVEIGWNSDHNLYVGFSENLSAGGLFVATYHPLPVGQRLTVEFTLPEDPQPVRSLVEVAWSKEQGDQEQGTPPGMGLRFVALDPADQARLAGFVQRRQPLFFPEVDELL